MCELRGIGVDLCGIGRMEKLAADERFLNRWFTPAEQAYIRSKGVAAAQTLAGIFAAKEAFAKALGTGIDMPLREIGVDHTETGQPVYALTGTAAERLGGDRALLSISHEGDMAAAFCVIQKRTE